MRSPADLIRIHRAVVAQRQAEKVRRIAQVHAASLQLEACIARHPAGKQKSPEVPASEDFTDATTVVGVERGRYAKSA